MPTFTTKNLVLFETEWRLLQYEKLYDVAPSCLLLQLGDESFCDITDLTELASSYFFPILGYGCMMFRI